MAPRKPVKKLKPVMKSAPMAPKTEACMCGPECNCGCGCCDRTLLGCHLAGLFLSKRMWLMVIASIVTVNVFEMVWNSQVMMPDYLATIHLWRPFDQMDFRLVYLANTLVAVFYAMLFKLAYRGTGIIAAIKTGLLISAPMAVCSGLLSFATMSIPGHLTGLWAAGNLLEGALVGLFLGLTAGCASCCKK